MKENSQNLTIGTFARVAGVNVETIRFYQRKGLLPEPTKPTGAFGGMEPRTLHGCGS